MFAKHRMSEKIHKELNQKFTSKGMEKTKWEQEEIASCRKRFGWNNFS